MAPSADPGVSIRSWSPHPFRRRKFLQPSAPLPALPQGWRGCSWGPGKIGTAKAATLLPTCQEALDWIGAQILPAGWGQGGRQAGGGGRDGSRGVGVTVGRERVRGTEDGGQRLEKGAMGLVGGGAGEGCAEGTRGVTQLAGSVWGRLSYQPRLIANASRLGKIPRGIALLPGSQAVSPAQR